MSERPVARVDRIENRSISLFEAFAILDWVTTFREAGARQMSTPALLEVARERASELRASVARAESQSAAQAVHDALFNPGALITREVDGKPVRGFDMTALRGRARQLLRGGRIEA